MGKGEPTEGEGAGARRVVYCVIPADLAPKLHDPLRRHFREMPAIEVVVDRRRGERRGQPERRRAEAEPSEDRRRVRNRQGRRVGDRRAETVSSQLRPQLPRRARPYADRISFVQRREPSGLHAEDLDTARLVIAFQSSERDAFTEIYNRYFDRVYAYLKTALRDSHGAEDATQQVFTQVLEALPRYERRRQPFRAWLFRIVRNQALGELRSRGRLEVVDPADIDQQRQRHDEAVEPSSADALSWITDRDLMLFIERLPLAQRQVLVLRYMLDLSDIQTAAVLGRSAVDVRTLQHRAVRFLNQRLTAIGRGPERSADRSAWRRRTRQAPVLRRRRFAIARSPRPS